MAIPVPVPRLGWSMEEGTFVQWLKQPGDVIKPGDTLFVLEGEKAAEEIAALDAGILHIPPEGPEPGDQVKVGQVIAYLTGAGEAAPSSGTTLPEVVCSPPPAVPLAARASVGQVGRHGPAVGVSAVAPAVSSRPRRTITPRARRVARELGVDSSGVPGSGRDGRIRERDVRAAAAGPTEGRLIPHTPLRRTIAARMVAAVTQAAPVTLTTKVDATNLRNLRQQFKAAASANDIVPSYTDLIVKLSALALQQHPLLQAQWREDGLFVPKRIDIALAVDTEAGLLVPVVRDVDKRSLREVAAQARELIGRARTGRLTNDEMRAATFTVTNLGHLGIDAFTPLLHLPQCAVLGVGRIVLEPAVVGDQIVTRDRMTLSLTFDHRVVDGAPAARFLDTLHRCLEQPAPWLMP